MARQPLGAGLGDGQRVLLVSHEASRTGAPRVAALIARSLVQSGHVVRIVSRTRGPLLADFESVAPTSVEPLVRVRRRWRGSRLGRRHARFADQLVAGGVILASRADLVYVNSAAAAAYLGPARWLGRRVILHLHESAALTRSFLDATVGDVNLTGVELVACSPSVRDELVGLVGPEAGEIRVVPSVPDADEVRHRAADEPDFRYQPDELVIGCCGSVEPRKGADLWVQAARIILQKLPDRHLRFVWVGSLGAPVETEPGEPIHFIGARANPYSHLGRFDIATLPSRDDPFPLVVLESMVLGVPVVAFAVGGVPAQVGEAGALVPPEDVDAFAHAVIELIEDPGTRGRLGEEGRRRVESIFSVASFGEAVTEAVRRS